MFEIGRVVVKTAGRDAGMTGVVIDVIDSTFVVVDGNLRRRKCNIRHLEPLDSKIKITKNAPHEEVASELRKAGVQVAEAKPRTRKPAEKKAETDVKPTEKKVKKARSFEKKAEPSPAVA